MPTWMTARQISNRFVVGEQRLLEYASRGNLAMYRLTDGSILFDGDGAARYFRLRGAAMSCDPDVKHLGVMGTTRLGEGYAAVDNSHNGRESRRQLLRTSGTNTPVPRDWAKTG